MNYPTKRLVEKLSNKKQDTTKVSIFIPTHPISNSANLNEDRIRFKNAVSEAKKDLEKQVRKKELEAICEKINAMYDDVDFWKHLSRTLAVFVSKDEIEIVYLDIEVEQTVHVGKSYFTLPLLAVLDRKTGYYVLDVNLEHPRLFKGNRYKFEQILDKELPEEMEQALRIDEHQKQLQHYAVRANTVAYHGHGAAKDKSDDEVVQYLRILDKTISKYELNGKGMPLILAGDENTISRFENISDYRNILPQKIIGNQQDRKLDDLHKDAWNIMLDKLSAEQQASTSRIKQLIGQKSNLVITDISHIERALEEGRVEALMIEMMTETNDSVLNRVVEAIKLRAFSKMTGEKISQLAEKTLAQSGKILPVKSDQLPTRQGQLAAILRY